MPAESGPTVLPVHLGGRRVGPGEPVYVIAELSANHGHDLETAKAIREKADERRVGRAGATRRFSEEDVALFPPHVLLELDSLRSGIERLTEDQFQKRLTGSQ